MATRGFVATLSADSVFTGPVAFSPDGTLLAADTHNGTQLWDVAERNLAATLPTGNSVIGSLAFSLDGTFLVVGASTGVKLWDVNTIQQFDSLSPDEAQSATFSHNGTLLAVSASGEPVQLLGVPYARNTLSYLCRMAGESFPPAEWAKYAPGVPYMKTCP